MAVALVAAGEELSVRAHERGVRMRVQAVAFDRIGRVLFHVHQRADGAVVMEAEEPYEGVVVHDLGVPEAVLAPDRAGRGVEGGVVGADEVALRLVQRQIGRAGAAALHAGKLCESSARGVIAEGPYETAAALGIVRVFVQLVGDIEDLPFPVEGRAVARKLRVLRAAKTQRAAAFVKIQQRHAGRAAVFLPAADKQGTQAKHPFICFLIEL